MSEYEWPLTFIHQTLYGYQIDQGGGETLKNITLYSLRDHLLFITVKEAEDLREGKGGVFPTEI